MPWVIIAVLGTMLVGIATRHEPSETTTNWSTRNGVTLPAQPVARPAPVAPQREIGRREVTGMPDGSQVPTTFKGYLRDVSQLPHHGAQPGDMWGVGSNLWVLTTPANSYKLGWVDPPGDESEVRRALPVDNVQVRRAKMVVPRAQLVELPMD